MKNKVGIVLVNYKNYKVTIECLKSLQKIDNFNECEIYVVDNGSNNHSEIELEKEKEIISFVLIVLNKNLHMVIMLVLKKHWKMAAIIYCY